MKNKEMKVILHYTVGLSNNRGGGLTKYTDDLTTYQSKNNKVIILYPGKKKLFNKTVKIQKEKNFNDVEVFSIINPLSLPMMFGLNDVEYLTKKTDLQLWCNFLKEKNVDLIHIHTFMGLYEEFIDAAKKLHIPIIYTTHDYFGLCPKQVLFYNGMICKNNKNCLDCSKCNSTALSKLKIFFVHSKLFTKLRKYKIFKILKVRAKKQIDLQNKNNRMNLDYYISLRNKMISMFNKITYFHFNSSISEKVFRENIKNIKGEIINLSHSDITDNRIIKTNLKKELQILYLGPATFVKGFFNLLDELDSVFDINKNFKLNIYTSCDEKRNYLCHKNDYYKYSDLKQIFLENDILIVPSLSYETFGFTTLEALSYGIPVIVMDNVGSKDLIKEGKNGYVIKKNEIHDKIIELLNNKNKIFLMNKYIYNDHFENFNEHCKKINKLYEKVEAKIDENY